jgi:hypothetical protein
MPLEEYKEKVLREWDAVYILELLQIDAAELLDRFEDKLIEFRESEDDGEDD